MDQPQPTRAYDVKNYKSPIVSCNFDIAYWFCAVPAKAAIIVPKPGSITLTKHKK